MGDKDNLPTVDAQRNEAKKCTSSWRKRSGIRRAGGSRDCLRGWSGAKAKLGRCALWRRQVSSAVEWRLTSLHLDICPGGGTCSRTDAPSLTSQTTRTVSRRPGPTPGTGSPGTASSGAAPPRTGPPRTRPPGRSASPGTAPPRTCTPRAGPPGASPPRTGTGPGRNAAPSGRTATKPWAPPAEDARRTATAPIAISPPRARPAKVLVPSRTEAAAWRTPPAARTILIIVTPPHTRGTATVASPPPALGRRRPPPPIATLPVGAAGASPIRTRALLIPPAAAAAAPLPLNLPLPAAARASARPRRRSSAKAGAKAATTPLGRSAPPSPQPAAARPAAPRPRPHAVHLAHVARRPPPALGPHDAAHFAVAENVCAIEGGACGVGLVAGRELDVRETAGRVGVEVAGHVDVEDGAVVAEGGLEGRRVGRRHVVAAAVEGEGVGVGATGAAAAALRRGRAIHVKSVVGRHGVWGGWVSGGR